MSALVRKLAAQTRDLSSSPGHSHILPLSRGDFFLYGFEIRSAVNKATEGSILGDCQHDNRLLSIY